jgi:hypothetical protein
MAEFASFSCGTCRLGTADAKGAVSIRPDD